MPRQSSIPAHPLTQTKQRQGYVLAGQVFRTKQDVTTRMHDMLYGYPIGAIVTPQDELLLLELLQHHPRAAEKIGAGIKRIRVKTNRLYTNTRYFWLERVDGSGMDFSYHKCIRPVSPWEEVMHAMRREIQSQMTERKTRVFGARTRIQCPITDVRCTWEEMHVDHRPPVTFAQLAKEYLVSKAMAAEAVELRDAPDCVGKILWDRWFAEDWAAYHQMFADLWVISIAAHLALTRQRLVKGDGEKGTVQATMR